MGKIYTNRLRMHYVLDWLRDNTSAEEPATPLKVAESLVLPDGRRWLDVMKNSSSASGTLLNIVDIGGVYSSRFNSVNKSLKAKERRPDLYELCRRVRRRRQDSGAFVYWMENPDA